MKNKKEIKMMASFILRGKRMVRHTTGYQSMKFPSQKKREGIFRQLKNRAMAQTFLT